MFVYCEKCALIKNVKNDDEICEVCGTAMLPVPKIHLSRSGTMFVSQEKRKEFINEIMKNPKFDEQIYLDRDSILNENKIRKTAEIEEKVEEYNRTRVKIQCPICHSERLEKISNVGKVIKVGAFGILGAGDIGKKYRCKSCGYRF